MVGTATRLLASNGVQAYRYAESVNTAIRADLASTTATHGQALWRKIRAMQEDCYIFACSDSTWNSTGEPFYRWVNEYLKPAVPTHTIIYRLYVDGSGWAAPSTLQTGTSGRTIYVDNCAVPGSGLQYLSGGKEVDVFQFGRTYDWLLINHGHNFGYLLTQTDLYPHMIMSVANLMNLCPQADVFITLQNPWLRYLSYSRATQSAWRRIAAELGLGIIDVSTRFEALPDFATQGVEGGTIDLTYYDQDGQGGLHPKEPTGVDVALPALVEAFAEREVSGAPTINRPLNRIAQNQIVNPAYTDWTGSTPTGHTFTNVTPSKSAAYAETGAYGMAMAIGAGTNPNKAIDLTSVLPRARKRWLTYIARIWVPSGLSSTTGRIQIYTTGASIRFSTSYPFTTGADGWRWVAVCHPILDTDVSITLNMLSGAADGSDSGKTFYVDREVSMPGMLPAELDPLLTNGGFISDLYAFTGTGIPSGFTGALALSGVGNTTLTVTSGTAGTTRAYINVRTVAGRQYRLSWGTRTFTGTAGLTISARGPNGAGTVITTSGSILNNQTLTFTATGSSHSFSINGGADVTGFALQSLSIAELYGGIATPIALNVTDARSSDLTTVDATGGSGKWQLSATLGTSAFLISQSATGATLTSTAVWEYVLPANYIPGRDLTVTLSSNHTGTGTPGTRTIDASLYRLASDGTSGADLVTTAAQTISGTIADYVFTATGTTLAPGDRIQVVAVGVIQETGAANSLTQRLLSVRVS